MYTCTHAHHSLLHLSFSLSSSGVNRIASWDCFISIHLHSGSSTPHPCNPSHSRGVPLHQSSPRPCPLQGGNKKPSRPASLCFLPPWVVLQCSFGLATRRFTNGSSLHAASTAAPATRSYAFTAATAQLETLQCCSPAAPSSRTAASAAFRSVLSFKSQSCSKLSARQPDLFQQPGQHPLLQPSEPVQHPRCRERIHVRRYDLTSRVSRGLSQTRLAQMPIRNATLTCDAQIPPR